MELRSRILTIGASIAALLLIVGGVVWFWSRRSPPPLELLGSSSTTSVPQGGVLPGANGGSVQRPPPARPAAPPLSPKEELKSDLASIAFSFTQRFGSYSNQGGFDNIDSLRFLMTRGMNNWADGYIAKLKAEPKPAEELYYGVTTTTLATAIESFDLASGRITMLVTTQRKETRGAPSNSTLVLQTLRLTFLNEEGTWKVDSAIWGAKERVDR